MRSTWRKSWILLGLVASACASAINTPPGSTPLPQPSSTPTPFPLTPVESALAPNNVTAAPLEEIIKSHSIQFDTPDGATITGELYGSGETAVIFSVMGDCSPGWREFAQLTAAQGIATLTYLWRGCRENGNVDNNEMKKFVDDLRGAITFMQKQGAKKIILAGASLGGVASAKLAAESHADGLIILASPAEIPQWGFKIEAADVNTKIPKLFISAEHDDTVSIDKTRALFDLAAEPKEWQIYPGSAHGTNLFETENKEELQKRILNFILAIASLR
jgi:alpha-beta hydrolase superfamily lysophospholipase